jgi:hypothetical protein
VTVIKCLCGGEYTRVPDSDVEDLPPSFTARRFHCDACGGSDWVTPDDLGYDEWPDDAP